MIPLVLFCILGAMHLAAFAFPGPLTPGIGFGLTADYGTAAIFLENRTSVNLAKIEGSLEYKAFMRRENGLPPDPPFCHILGTCPRKHDFDAAKAMLATLKSSAEAYLGSRFSFADAVIPNNDGSYQKEIVEAAFGAHGLRQTFQIQSAGKFAVLANEPQGIELPYEQIALAIDYSRSGLNLDLFCDDIGVLDHLGEHHELGIGADNPDPARWAAVSAALERISQPPISRCPMGRKDHDHIDYLVFYGDSTADEHFLRVVTDVLGSDLVSVARARDPEFASTIIAAEVCFNKQNSPFAGVPPEEL